MTTTCDLSPLARVADELDELADGINDLAERGRRLLSLPGIPAAVRESALDGWYRYLDRATGRERRTTVEQTADALRALAAGA